MNSSTRPTERISNTGPEYPVQDLYKTDDNGSWPQRRGMMCNGKWHAVDDRYRELLDECGVPAEMTWESEHDFLEDLESYLKGKTEYTATPQDVARFGLLGGVVWHWDAESQLFRGWKRRIWETYARKDEALVKWAERLTNSLQGDAK